MERRSGTVGVAQVAAGQPLAALGAPTARAGLAAWLALAVGSLILAGCFALLLVLGRTPPFDALITDPTLFRRALVVHVDLALVIWFYAFLGALTCLLPTRRPLPGASALGAATAAAGVLMLVGGALTAADPILANYVPVIDHPLFLAGLVTFAAGLVLTLLDGRLLPGGEGRGGPADAAPEARPGLRAAGVAFLLALCTLIASATATPAGLTAEVRYELLLWGPGHVLQVASTCAMVSAWLLLLTPALGRAPFSRRTAGLLFGALVLPLLAAPLLAAGGTTTVAYHDGFTRLMRWGIFPAVSVALVLCLRALWRARRAGRLEGGLLADARVAGFLVSAALTLLGFLLGALIRGSNTVIPAHYHASLGGVTASFMAVTYLLLQGLGLELSARQQRLARVQPVLFGLGQMVFACGFALAGAHGAARKVYGAEQAGRSLAETAGLAVMGLGGLVAVAGGTLFLAIVVGAWLRGRRTALVLPAPRTSDLFLSTNVRSAPWTETPK